MIFLPNKLLPLLLAILVSWTGISHAQLGFDSASAESGVYRIINYGPKQRDGSFSISTGSGFLINRAGIVVTNYHVTHGYDRLYAVQMKSDGIKVWKAKVVYGSPDKDIALLRVPGIEGVPAKLATALPEKATAAFAVGFPAFADEQREVVAFHRELKRAGYTDIALNDGYNNYVSASVKVGNVEDIRKVRWGYPDRQFRLNAIAHNAPISGGNSGGPLFNQNNDVIGINTSGRWDNSGLGAKLMYSSAIRALTDILDEQDYAYNEAVVADGTITAPPDGDGGGGAAIRKSEQNGGDRKTGGSVAVPPLIALPPTSNPDLLPILIFAAAGLLGLIAIAVALRRPRPQLQSEFGNTPAAPPAVSGTVRTQPARTPAREERKRQLRDKPRAPALRISISGKTSDGTRIDQRLRESDFKSATDGVMVGRDRKVCQIHIPDQSVSRKHIELRLTGGGKTFSVVDLGSANGTNLNGKKIPRRAQTELREGDTIKIGEVVLRIGITGTSA